MTSGTFIQANENMKLNNTIVIFNLITGKYIISPLCLITGLYYHQMVSDFFFNTSKIGGLRLEI